MSTGFNSSLQAIDSPFGAGCFFSKKDHRQVVCSEATMVVGFKVHVWSTRPNPLCWSPNSPLDGHQPNSREEIHTYYKDSLIQGGMNLSPI